MGPYRVISVLDNDRYEVEKMGGGPGPQRTSTVAEHMKPWAVYDDSDGDEDEEDG